MRVLVNWQEKQGKIVGGGGGGGLDWHLFLLLSLLVVCLVSIYPFWLDTEKKKTDKNKG